MNHSNPPNNKRVRPDPNPSLLCPSLTKKPRNSSIISTAHIDLITLPYNSHNSKLFSSIIQPNRVYTIGRTKNADVIFNNPRVSKQHCQLLFDSSLNKLYLLNGALLLNYRDFNCCCIVDRFRVRLLVNGKGRQTPCCDCVFDFKASLNGVFVNGVKLDEGLVVELCVGDEVMLVCGNRDGGCDLGSRVGFVVRRVVYGQEVVLSECQGFRFSGKVSKRVFALRVCDLELRGGESDRVVGRANSLSAQCKQILRSCDPVSCILKLLGSDCCVSYESGFRGFELGREIQVEGKCGPPINGAIMPDSRVKANPGVSVENFNGGVALRDFIANSYDIVCSRDEVVPRGDQLFPKECDVFSKTNIVDDPTTLSNTSRRDSPELKAAGQNECLKENIPPPVKNFYLNRLESLQYSLSSQQKVVSLPELLHPVSSISRIFIATFTSDIRWFLSYCDIPSHLPLTLACHSTERCWSGDPEKRSCVPYSDFPNLVVVYPPFPQAIAFGNDRKKQGVACHHPKLLVLQREDNLRVIVTSANLNAKQWNNVTNTIWWQDFPRRNTPDWASLFNQVHNECANSVSKSDFAAQLAGFMATLLTDVPSQAYWISELTKYDFSGANVYLVASVPGIHSHRSISASIPDSVSKCSETLFGSVDASVVGLSHLFRTAADSNGIKLKRLAAYLGESSEKGYGMSEIMLRRDKNIPADSNALSVLVPDPIEFSKDDCVQLGFLPRTVAKWVSPLWDACIFTFRGYVCPREALAAAFEENSKKVLLTLYVSQGPNFQDIQKMLEPELHIAFCCLIAFVQRCTGVWRLEEILHQYKWPEHLESDFIYGSSSIGTSIGAQFLSTFSSAAGKKSQQLFDSEESDPEWGCWNASHELKHPSIKILFPTIERVKNAYYGILPSKTILCFSEKTWQRLKPVDILHDAIPYPNCRVGFPMHVKVARRRFKSKTDASSFGWLYCGSHNMSAAAWGWQLSGTDKGYSSRSRLHVCNYELGVIFVFPPPVIEGSKTKLNKSPGLDDIQLPFVVPAPKYRPSDRPATMRAMREAMVELAERGGETVLSEQVVSATEEMVEMDEEEEDENVVEAVNYAAQEDEEMAYADVLWNQVDSYHSS